MKTAIITGISGQDGSYLSELLLSKGYEVHGFIRRATAITRDDIHYHFVDLMNGEEVSRNVEEIAPDEIYNLAAQSHVGTSFECPEVTGNITGLGLVRILEAVRHKSPDTRIYQASSSEMFGSSPPMQDEKTPFVALSPYAAAKIYAHNIAGLYRTAYGMHVNCGILFNHESPRRGENFVTRKITRGIADIVNGRTDKIYLGNLFAIRDWGYAPEYVEIMWKMLQSSEPDDYVIGTGEGHSIVEFLEEAFAYADLDIERNVSITKTNMRPTDVPALIANSDKARFVLDWDPKVRFKELVKIMVEADLNAG